MQHFDIAVIGSGSGNSIIDERFSHLQTALIERDDTFGGTCLNRGCIPSKMLSVTADFAASPAHALRLGVELGEAKADWPAIRDRIFGRIDPISAGGLQWRQSNDYVSMLHGQASFLSPHEVQVGQNTISADQFVIATGSRPRTLLAPVAPAVAHLVHTSDTIMRIENFPERLIVVGAGYVGLEFAHIFQALGSHVTVIQHSGRILGDADEDVSAALATALSRRISIRLNQAVAAIEEGDNQPLEVITTDRNGVEYPYTADAVLVATGRIRNSDALNLAAAGVDVGANGQIRVDDTQRTSASHIWALGDVSSDFMLKHVANAEARTVQHNLANPAELARTDHRHVPSAVFTSPQVASIGATEQQLRSWGAPYVSYTQPYADVAYGWALEDRGSFVKLLADPRHWRVLGAHIIGPQAATLIQPLIQAMSFGLSVEDMARGQYWIHPGLPEAVENALLGLLSSEPEALEAP